MSQRATVRNMKIDMREKENQIARLIEENNQLREESKIKDDSNDALAAANNSLEDAKQMLESKTKYLIETKSKYKARLKTYGATIK